MADFWISSWIFIFGLVVGSFLNVCIHRIPIGLSIIRPGSACTSCRHPIAWFDNIPVVSYLILGRKCRYCRIPISPRYALVEVLTACLFVMVYQCLGDRGWTIVGLALTAALIVCTFIDFEHFIIPDIITLPGIVLGLMLHFLFPNLATLHSAGGHWWALLWSFQGAIIGGGSLWLVAVIGRKLYGKEVMGLGDVKLMAMVGALLGWKNALLGIFLGSLVGSLVGIVLVLSKTAKWQSRIPFGPYLSMGSLMALLAGEDLLQWYMSLLVSTGS